MKFKFCKMFKKSKPSMAWVWFVVIGFILSIVILVVFQSLQEPIEDSSSKQVLGDKTVDRGAMIEQATEFTFEKYRADLLSLQEGLAELDTFADVSKSAERFFLGTKVPGDLRNAHLAGLLEYQTAADSGDVGILKEKLFQIATELLGQL